MAIYFNDGSKVRNASQIYMGIGGKPKRIQSIYYGIGGKGKEIYVGTEKIAILENFSINVKTTFTEGLYTKSKVITGTIISSQDSPLPLYQDGHSYRTSASKIKLRGQVRLGGTFTSNNNYSKTNITPFILNELVNGSYLFCCGNLSNSFYGDLKNSNLENLEIGFGSFSHAYNIKNIPNYFPKLYNPADMFANSIIEWNNKDLIFSHDSISDLFRTFEYVSFLNCNSIFLKYVITPDGFYRSFTGFNSYPGSCLISGNFEDTGTSSDSYSFNSMFAGSKNINLNITLIRRTRNYNLVSTFADCLCGGNIILNSNCTYGNLNFMFRNRNSTYPLLNIKINNQLIYTAFTKSSYSSVADKDNIYGKLYSMNWETREDGSLYSPVVNLAVYKI